MEIIKEDCVVFFLDNATDVHFQQMDQAAKETCDMEITYEPCVEDLQCLTYESIEKFLEIYEGHFDLYNCMTNGFMSYCVWRKVRDILVSDEVKEKERQEKLKSQKNNELLTKKMKDYKRKLRRCVEDVEKLNREKSKVSWRREAKESSHPTNYTTERKQNIFEDIGNRKLQTLTEQHESIGATENDISKEFYLKNRSNIKNVDEKETNCNLMIDEGRQTVNNETIKIMESESKEKASINDLNKPHRNRENETSIEKEIRSKDREEEKNVPRNTSEDNQGEGTEKGDPVKINESKDASKEKPKSPLNPLQKPWKLNSKDHASLSQQEDNDGQHDDTIAEERNAKPQKCNDEGESNRNKIYITEIQENYPKGSDVQPPTYNDQVENNKQKSQIHFSCYETGKVTISEEAEAEEVTLMKKPNVPTAPLKRPRGRKNSGVPSSNNEEENEGTILDKIISKETCESTFSDKIQLKHAPKIPSVALPKPRNLRKL